MNDAITESILNFCMIEMQLLKEKEKSLRKELLNCKIRKEYLESLVADISFSTKKAE
tara:strand:- start:2081 stop:2251 length:171 start_codon:yes stop_codon:yes gene_type:complete